MNNILLVLINLDSKSLLDDDKKIDEILEKIEETREKSKIDYSFLSFYSNVEMYYSRDIMKSINKKRDKYPKVILGKSFTKNDGNLTSGFFSRDDRNKEYIFSYMMKYLSKFIDVNGVLIFDDNLKLIMEDFNKIFGNRNLNVIKSVDPVKKKKFIF